MFIRIVKMSFHEDKIADYLANFHEVKDKIRHFEGNTCLELYQDKHNKSVIFTYSMWESEENLKNYRHSDLFKEDRGYNITLSNDKPQAWSVDKLVTLE